MGATVVGNQQQKKNCLHRKLIKPVPRPALHAEIDCHTAKLPVYHQNKAVKEIGEALTLAAWILARCTLAPDSRFIESSAQIKP